MGLLDRPMWVHQMHGCDGVTTAAAAGEQLILLTSPTGMGKSVMVFWLIRHYVSLGWHSALYTNRRMLMDQLSENLEAAGIPHGLRAANARDERDEPVQISSIQTEQSRTLKADADDLGAWAIHGTGRKCVAFVDEAHLNTGPGVRELIRRHVAAGHVVVGVTATPIGLGDIYRVLIRAGTVSEGRTCGALVMANTYAPDEPDFQRLKKKPPVGEDIPPKELRKAFPMNKALFGRVIDTYKALNPDGRPAILFAAGVKESLWFAEEFTKAGVPAAHIDGDFVWFPTDNFPAGFEYANRNSRDRLLSASRDGVVRVVCNRFVLREGIDAPWLQHGIFATTFGSLQTYLQAGGRLLRAGDSREPVTVQDHGGNWWRHGSLNADRDWHISDTPASVVGGRHECLKNRICRKCWRKNPRLMPYCPFCGCPAEREPAVCPKCARVLHGRKCPSEGCGYTLPLGFKSRTVIQSDGNLRQQKGDIFRPERVASAPDAIGEWKKYYFRALRGKGKLTFAQARALYAKDHHWGWPSTDWPYMPRNPFDLYRRVCDVPPDELIRFGERRPTAEETADEDLPVRRVPDRDPA